MKKRLGLVFMGAIFGIWLAACTPTAAPTPTPVKAPAATATAALPAATLTSVAPAAVPTPTVPAATPAPTKPAAAPTVAAPAATSTVAAAATPAPTKPAATPTVAAPAATPTAAAPAATPAPTKPAGTAGDPVAGKAVFDSNCTACHPGGQQGAGPSLVGAVGRLNEAGVRNQIRNGGGIMPPSPDNRINDKQLSDLIAYVATLK